MKKRLILVTAGALLALTPAAAGAIGNTSLSHRVPVTGPTATLEAGDDKGGLSDRDQRTEAGDDRDAQGSPTTTPSPSASHDASHDATDDHGSDDPATHDAGDDNGGPSDRDQRTEAGDDRDATDDHGSDDPATHDAGDDKGSESSGHGSDDPATHDAGDVSRHGGSDD